MSDSEPEKKVAEDYIKDLSNRFKDKYELRQANTEKNGDAAIKRRDANVKKTAAFIKKLKTVTENQHQALLNEATGLDLSRYIAEIVQALTNDCKLKIADISFALKLCCHLHQTYNEFSSLYASAWQKNCAIPLKPVDGKDSGNTFTVNANKLKIDIRLLSEFILIGIWPNEREGYKLLAGQLKEMTNSPEAAMFLPVIVNFLKNFGPEYANLYPRKYVSIVQKYNLQLPALDSVPDQFKEGCRRLLKEYLNTVFKKLSQDQTELQEMESHCLKMLQLRGEIPAEDRNKWEAGKLDFERLKNNVANLADLVDEDTPVLEQPTRNENDTEQKSERQQLLDAAAAVLEGNVQEPADLFVDENELSFYRTLPELKQEENVPKDDDVDEGNCFFFIFGINSFVNLRGWGG